MRLCVVLRSLAGLEDHLGHTVYFPKPAVSKELGHAQAEVISVSVPVVESTPLGESLCSSSELIFLHYLILTKKTVASEIAFVRLNAVHLRLGLEGPSREGEVSR